MIFKSIKTILSIFFFLSLLEGSAQEQGKLVEYRERGISVGLGLRSFLLNDEIGSNLNYNGVSFSTHLSYNSQTQKTSQDVNIYFSDSELSNDVNRNSMNGIFLVAEYHRRFRLTRQLGNDISIYVGPYLKFQGFGRDFVYENLNNSKSTGDAFGSLGISGLVSKTIGEANKINLNFHLPILTFYMDSRSYNELLLINQFADYLIGSAFLMGSPDEPVRFFASIQYNFYSNNQFMRIVYGSYLFEIGLKFKV